MTQLCQKLEKLSENFTVPHWVPIDKIYANFSRIMPNYVQGQVINLFHFAFVFLVWQWREPMDIHSAFAENLAWPDSMWIFHFSFMPRNYWCSFLSIFFRFQCVLFVCAYYLMQYGNGVIFQGIRLNNVCLKERNFELTQKVINTGLLCLTKYAPSDFTAILLTYCFIWLKLHVKLLTILLTKWLCLYANKLALSYIIICKPRLCRNRSRIVAPHISPIL